MKLIKLLTVPAVLLFSLLMAAPVSATNTLQQATVTVGCGTETHAGEVCVTLTGDIETGNAKRFVFFDLFATGSNTPLPDEEIVFHLPAFNTEDATKNHFKKKICFPAVTNSTANSFVVKVVKVTRDSEGKHPSDLVLKLPGGNITFDSHDQPSTAVGSTDKCLAPSASTAALAQTGGLDYRFPLIGLTVIVAGLALFLVSASRARRSPGPATAAAAVSGHGMGGRPGAPGG